MKKIIDEDGKEILFAIKGDTIGVYYEESEAECVKSAIYSLIHDMKAVGEVDLIRTKVITNAKISIKTIETKKLCSIDIMGHEIPVSKLWDQEKNRWKREGYLIEVNQDCIYIVGTEPRGTIYGIYDLCEELGVSPWYYFADVPITKRDRIVLQQDGCKIEYPTITYRGIFINDEEELNQWAKLHTKDGTIGPSTYKRIFELLLRLRANYIWPAMHVNYFNENPENGRLAHSMGIIVGTSHCDMLLRSNQNEWEPWIQKKGYEGTVYDYSIDGENRERLQEYWRESVELNKAYDVTYSVGMRGIHDYGFQTLAIDQNPATSDSEKKEARVALLSQIIRDQRELLKEILGEEKGEQAPQIFVPYKEVLDLYDAGLTVPEDVTLVWVDDNYGYIRRYPNEEEQQRVGGNGLYYHSSYWAAPGMSYLFLNSIPLAHVKNELHKAYEQGIRKLWVQNIGAIKPLEQDMDFVMRYAWSVGQGTMEDVSQYVADWFGDMFGPRYGAVIARLYAEYAQITNVCKVEHMHSNTFTQTVYGDEGARRLYRLEQLYGKVNEIMRQMDESRREAFFQIIGMKIHASYYINHQFYYADRSTLCYNQGKMQAADWYLMKSRRMDHYKKRMLHYYNKKMTHGKWDGIVTPEQFAPPVTAMYPAGKPALYIGEPELGVIVWDEYQQGEKGILTFEACGKGVKWIELYNTGMGSIPYRIEAEPWVILSEQTGSLVTEQRIEISIDSYEKRRGCIAKLSIVNELDETTTTIPLIVKDTPLQSEQLACYVEADGVISMLAAQYDRCSTSKCGYWHKIPDMGRYEGDAVEAIVCNEEGEPPTLEYEFYVTSSGEFELELYRVPTLNSTGKIRLFVGIDSLPARLISSSTTDEWVGQWQEAVVHNVDRLLLPLPYITKGRHILRITMVDSYVTLSKLVIYTSGYRYTNLGPTVSYHSRFHPDMESETERIYVDERELEKVATMFYHTEEDEIRLPPMYYAGHGYWEKTHVFDLNEQVEQQQLGVPCYASQLGEGKQLITQFGQGVFLEEEGVIALEAEYVLEQSQYAYSIPSVEHNVIAWEHTQAETNGGTGLAMHIPWVGQMWSNPYIAPSMNYLVHINNPGCYYIWLLVRVEDRESDSCYFSLDGVVQPIEKQYCKDGVWTYSNEQVWFWALISEMEFTSGTHEFGIIARKSRFRIDRIYMTMGMENPPIDAHWNSSKRQ